MLMLNYTRCAHIHCDRDIRIDIANIREQRFGVALCEEHAASVVRAWIASASYGVRGTLFDYTAHGVTYTGHTEDCDDIVRRIVDGVAALPAICPRCDCAGCDPETCAAALSIDASYALGFGHGQDCASGVAQDPIAVVDVTDEPEEVVASGDAARCSYRRGYVAGWNSEATRG